MTRSKLLLSIALVAALAACSAERTPADAAMPPDAQADAQPTDAAPVTDTAAAPDPSTDAGVTLASFEGYGDIMFGTPAAGMEDAWGGELKVLGKEYNESCYFMTPVSTKVPAELAFMIGDETFVRVGTESSALTAPGGGKVGMSKAEIARLYTAIEVAPHKYSDGEYLEIKDPAGGGALLIFETDGKGDDARVTEWRVGTPPHVGYVEGCS